MTLRNGKRGCVIALGVLALLVVVFLVSPPGRAFLDIWKSGAVQEAMAGAEKHDYEGSSTKNLKAIYTAMMLYHDSEGQFPVAAGWMDAIGNRLVVNDLKEGEAQKKLIRPDLASQPGSFGYAMNDDASGKYKDDVKGVDVPLVYESKQTGRNAHGNPKDDHSSGLYISVNGSIGHLKP